MAYVLDQKDRGVINLTAVGQQYSFPRVLQHGFAQGDFRFIAVIDISVRPYCLSGKERIIGMKIPDQVFGKAAEFNERFSTFMPLLFSCSCLIII